MRIPTLLRRPALAIPAIAGLIVGIGASTAVFSAFRAIEFESMGLRDPARLAAIWLQDVPHNHPQVELSYGDWRPLHNVADVALASSVNLDFTIYRDGRPEHIDGSTVSGNFFSVLGAKPLAGRFLEPADDQPGAPVRLVLSYQTFQSRFAGDYRIIGQQIRFADSTATVVGIARPEFDFPRDTSVWLPLRVASPNIEQSMWLGVFRSVARLAPGLSLAETQSRLDAALRQDTSRPATEPVYTTQVKPIRDEAYGLARPAIAILMAAVLLLMLIACANAANLLLAMHAERRAELAMRVALGASRLRIVRLLLSESATIAAISGAGGLLLARAAIAAFQKFAPPEMPGVDRIALEWPVATFAIALTAITLFLFSLGPALLASQIDLRTSRTHVQKRLRHFAIAAEVALSAMLVCGAGLLVKSFENLAAVDPGFHSDNILTFRITTELSDQRARKAVYTQVLDRVRALPGVESAGAILLRPLSGTVGWDTIYRTEDQPSDQKANPSGNYEAISPDYFRAMRIPLIEGRDFSTNDNETAPGVVIINRSTAQRHWHNQSAIGRRLRLGGPKQPWLTVVGVVADVRYREWETAHPDFYIPYLQRAQHRSDFVIRTQGDPWKLAAAVRQAVFDVDKNQPISNVTTLEALVGRALARARFTAGLLVIVALCAGALAAIGIYGLLAYSVRQRTREIGVRSALGAKPQQVATLITIDVIRFVAAGLAAGIAGSLLTANLVRSQFYGVSAYDAPTYVLTIAVLSLISVAAAAGPAWRAASIDPASALRT